MGALQKNIFEHISLMAQEQLEIEFREEIQQLMQLQQMAQVNPAMAQVSRDSTTTFIVKFIN